MDNRTSSPTPRARIARAARAFVSFPTDRARERLISLSTTALVLIAGFGTFDMSMCARA